MVELLWDSRHEEQYRRPEQVAVSQNPDVYLETVETAKDEETEPDKAGDTGILCMYGGEQPKRVLENVQHNNGQ